MTDSTLPVVPARLSRLADLSRDLRWTWHSTRDVFRRLDYRLWRETAHNPVLMLRRVDQAVLDRAAADPAFLAMYDDAVASYEAARAPGGGRSWWSQEVRGDSREVVAYFCAEFALHQSLPIYAGGLGVLAGDHCKEASDLGIPLVGVGFMYPQGYFRQRISPDGCRQSPQIHQCSCPSF
jgi:starch phosphorylase